MPLGSLGLVHRGDGARPVVAHVCVPILVPVQTDPVPAAFSQQAHSLPSPASPTQSVSSVHCHPCARPRPGDSQTSDAVQTKGGRHVSLNPQHPWPNVPHAAASGPGPGPASRTRVGPSDDPSSDPLESTKVASAASISEVESAEPPMESAVPSMDDVVASEA